VESELTAHPLIAQAMVWGEAQADNVAVLILRRPDASDHDIRRALAEVNRGLPDYARVARWICAAQPFSAACGLLTANGRLRREAILARYQARIDECYRTFAPLSSNGVIP
jgi:long-subunit acyl-CoA synthetase (AMP-forming)